jgi:hypothetical protein
MRWCHGVILRYSLILVRKRYDGDCTGDGTDGCSDHPAAKRLAVLTNDPIDLAYDDTELQQLNEQLISAERGCSTVNFEGGLSGTPSRYGT